MKAFYCDHFVLPLPEKHRFPMSKYSLLRTGVVERGLIEPADLRVPEPACDHELLRVHDPAYLARVVGGGLDRHEVRAMGFPWSPELVERSRRSVGGTTSAARVALEEGVAVNLAGGTHHAFADSGHGFCVFNDLAVAARTLQSEGAVSNVLIVDCDVHQGDGTAKIFEQDPTVVTLSLHGRKNFPFRKQKSDLDVALDDGVADDEYLDHLRAALSTLFDRGPFGVVLYQAGADPFEGDRLGRLSLSKAGLMERDRLVFETCRASSTPIVVVMGGGYAHDVMDTVDIHLQTVACARESWARFQPLAAG
jgi:acetoin utilization deacetylase AcuC-like enzyme